MCLVVFAYKMSDNYPLVLAANRDEFFQRDTAPMHFWEDHPSILAGRDLVEMGTWFGIHKSGKMAALTNYRDPSLIKTSAPSRGEIIVDFLSSTMKPDRYLATLKRTSQKYNGFNLLLADTASMFWFSNITNESKKIEPGIYGVSNHLFDTGWPKIQTGKKNLEHLLNVKPEVDFKSLFDFLSNSTIAQDEQLPDTGVGLEWERILSPLFITSPTYGTVSSTAVIINKKNEINVCERSYVFGNFEKFHDSAFKITPV